MIDHGHLNRDLVCSEKQPELFSGCTNAISVRVARRGEVIRAEAEIVRAPHLGYTLRMQDSSAQGPIRSAACAANSRVSRALQGAEI